MARNKKRTRPMIRIPKDPSGPDTRYISVTDEEFPQVQRLLGFKGKRKSGGVYSFYMEGDDEGGPVSGVGLGGGSYSGLSGSSNTSSSPHASRGSAIGGSTSRASQSNIGGSQTGGSTSGSSSSHASSSNRSSPAGGGGRPSGGGGQGDNRGGGGGQAPSSRESGGGGGNRSSGGGGNMGTRGGVQAGRGGGAGNQPSAGRTPGGGAQPGSGALGQMARSMAPGTRTPGGGAPPASGMLGQMAGSRPRAPGSAMGLLGATRSPQKMQDRIGPEEGRGPLGPGGEPTGFDPSRPVGLPSKMQDRIAPDPNYVSPSRNTITGEPGLTGPPRTPTLMGDFERHPIDRIRNEALQDLAIAEGTLNENTYGMDPYKALNNWAQGEVEPPDDPENMSIKDWTEWQDKTMRAYGPPKAAPSLAFQGMPRSYIDAANRLGIDIATTNMTPETQRLLAGEIARHKSVQSQFASLNQNTAYGRRHADELERVEAAKQAGAFGPLKGQGMEPNYDDPVATAGIIGSKANQPGIADTGDFGIIPGESPFVDDVGPFGNRMFGDPVPAENTVRINPAATGPTKQITDRIAPDPNYQPGEGTYNPTTQRVDFSPEQRARIAQGNALLGTTLNDLPTDYTGLLGTPPKIQDRVVERYEPSDMTYNMDVAIGRHAVDIADMKRAAQRAEQEAEQEEDTTGVLSPPTRGPIPGYIPTLQPPIPREKPQFMGSLPDTFPGRSRVPRMQEPVDITQQTNWPEDLEPSSGMPRGTTLQEAEIENNIPGPTLDENGNPTYPDERFERLEKDPTDTVSSTPVHVTVRNNVIRQYGEGNESTEILNTVAAIKQAMGYGTKHGQRGGGRRGRGIGQLAQAPRRRRSSVIPPEAPLLET